MLSNFCFNLHVLKRRLLLGRKVVTNLDSILKSRDITLPTKVCLVKAMVFPAVMYGCERWTVKKAEHRRIDAFELWCWRRLLWVPWRLKEIQPVHSKGDQSWVFFGRNDAKAEIPVLWPPHVKSWVIGKDFDVGRDWGQEEKGMTENEKAGWHYRLDGHEFGWTPGVGDGQGGLACCDSWGRKESDRTERLNWTELTECPVAFPGGSVVKNPPANAGNARDAISIPGSRRSPGKENSNPLQYSCLENSIDKRILAGYSPWGDKETDLTKRLRTHTQHGQWPWVTLVFGAQQSHYMKYILVSIFIRFSKYYSKI